MMNQNSKVISVGADAEVKYVEGNALPDYLKEEIRLLQKCTDPVARESRRLRLALLCEQQGETQEAVDLYRDVLRNVGQPTKPSQLYDIAHQAYQGVSRLWETEDEYVWETASQTLEEAKDLFA